MWLGSHEASASGGSLFECYMLCVKNPLSGCHGDPQQSPHCCGSRHHVGGVVICSVSLGIFFWEVHYPWGSLSFPVCLALRSPPDGKCLLLITHRWTVHTEECVHICICLPVTPFIFVTVFTGNPKVVAHVFDFEISP